MGSAAALTVQNNETRVEITATGPMVRTIDGMAEIINGGMAVASLAPRSAQAYYTGLLARLMGGKLHISLKPEQLSLYGTFAA